MPAVDRLKLKQLLERERASYIERNPKSKALYKEATNLFGGVPMTWMNKWSGGFPLYLKTAHGNTITTVAVGPLRCLAKIKSASPARGDSRS